jgi:hypothetical protein
MEMVLPKNINNKLKGGGICVFIRAYNDLDHITPIIYKLNQLYPNIGIELILSDHSLDLGGDYRIRYLEKISIDLYTLSDFKIINKSVQSLYYFLDIKTRGMKRFNPIRIMCRIILKFIDKRVNEVKDNLNIKKFIRDNFEVYPKLFLFDHSRSSFYFNVCTFAKNNSIPTVSVPHGHTLLLNQLHKCNHMQYEENKHPASLKVKYFYDNTIFENQNIRDRYISYGIFNEQNSFVIGSSRYSDEWMEIIKKIIDKQNINYGHDQKLKIVLMLSKASYNSFFEEIVRTIQFIIQFPDVFLIVKPHTRNKSINIETNNNLFVDNSHEYHSTNLIDWSDLVIFEHSCISFHALKLDKPTLYLSSTHANRLMSEPYFTSWEAKTRDEIRHTIWRLLEDKNYRTYKKEDAESFIRDIIEPKGKDVLGEYARFIHDLI